MSDPDCFFHDRASLSRLEPPLLDGDLPRQAFGLDQRNSTFLAYFSSAATPTRVSGARGEGRPIWELSIVDVKAMRCETTSEIDFIGAFDIAGITYDEARKEVRIAT